MSWTQYPELFPERIKPTPPLAQPFDYPTPSQEVRPLHPIQWQERTWQLNPSWYQVEKTVKSVARVFRYLGVAGAGATLGMAFFLTGTPTFILTTISVSAAISMITYLAGRFMVPSHFWSDPAYRRRQGEAAWNEIQRNELSYTQIKRRYGQLIDRAVITRDDLRSWVDSLGLTRDYHALTERLGREVLEIFSGEEKELLRLQLLAQIASEEKGILEINQEYSSELRLLSISEELLATHVVPSELERAEHATDFLQRNGAGVLTLLSDEQRTFLRELILWEGVMNKLRAEAITERYGRHFDLLRIDLTAMRREEAETDFQRFVKGEIDYDQLRQHGLGFIEEKSAFLRADLVAHLKQLSLPLPTLQQRYQQDLVILPLLPQEWQELLQPEVSRAVEQGYADFRERNGSGALALLSESQKEQLVPQAHNFLASIEQMGWLELQREYAPELEQLSVGHAVIRDSVLLRESRSSLNSSYSRFRERNGVPDKGLPADVEAGLRELYFQMPYREMVAARYEEDRCGLGIKEGEPALIVQDLAASLSYSEFIRRVGIEALELVDFEPTVLDALKRGFLDSCSGLSLAEIQRRRQEVVALGIFEPEIGALLSREIPTLSFSDFIRKHGVESVRSTTLFPPEDRQALLNKGREAFRSLPYSEARDLLPALHALGAEEEALYLLRWQGCSVDCIVENHEERREFLRRVPTFQGEPLWQEKAAELNGWSLEQLVAEPELLQLFKAALPSLEPKLVALLSSFGLGALSPLWNQLDHLSLIPERLKQCRQEAMDEVSRIERDLEQQERQTEELFRLREERPLTQQERLRCDRLESDCQYARERSAAARQELKVLEQQKSAANTELHRARSELHQTEGRIEALRHDLAAGRVRAGELQAQLEPLDEFQQGLASLEERASELTMELAKEVTGLAAAARQAVANREYRAELDCIKEEIAELKSVAAEWRELRENIERNQRQLADQEAKIPALTRVVEEWRAQASESEERYSAAQRSSAPLLGELAQAEEELRYYNQELIRIQERHKRQVRQEKEARLSELRNHRDRDIARFERVYRHQLSQNQ